MNYSIRKTPSVYAKRITNSIDELAYDWSVKPISAKGLKSAYKGKNTDYGANYPVDCGEEAGNAPDGGKPCSKNNR